MRRAALPEHRHGHRPLPALSRLPLEPEVAWQAENYVHSRTGQRLADFYRLAREGKIGIQALYCNMLTGLCSHEEACRLTWFAHQLCREHGIPYRSAMISDVPTQEASLPMILAGGGHPLFQQRDQQRPGLPVHADAEQVPVLVGRPRRQPRADDVHLAVRPGRPVGAGPERRGGPGAGARQISAVREPRAIIPTTPSSCTGRSATTSR